MKAHGLTTNAKVKYLQYSLFEPHEVIRNLEWFQNSKCSHSFVQDLNMVGICIMKMH